MKPYDHSVTYKKLKLRNIPHILRLKKIISTLHSHIRDKNSLKNYGDFGCSNGFITNLVMKNLKPYNVYGYDHSIDNIKIAKNKYSKINFDYVDLNQSNISNFPRFDLITCFETLEHVPDINIALQNLLKLSEENGIIFLSVPVEVGMIGILKFIIKMLYGYNLNELNTTRLNYFTCLVGSRGISQFRSSKRDGYGTHFGFDYNQVEKYLHSNDIAFESFTYFTTRFVIINNL